MAKTTTKTRRAGNSAKNANTARKKTRGKPFAKGNPFAFKPGQSGNPAGRPRDTVTPHLRELVRMRHSEKDGVTYGEMVARSLLTRAIIDAGLDMLKRTGLSDEEAAALLTTIYPEVSTWVN